VSEEIDQKKIYEIITRNLPIGFSIVNKEGIIVDFNTTAEAITGFRKTEVLGRSHYQILHGGSDSQATCPLLKHALQQREKIVETESIIRKKNGKQIIISVTAFPMIDDKGNLIGGVELFRDITSRKKLERERKNMLSMFAHDIKNPVMTSAGFLSRILSEKAGKLTEKQKNYLEIVNENLGKIENLITNFLEFSRLETEKYIPKIEYYDIVSAIKKIAEIMAIDADKKNIKILFKCPEKYPNIIPADPIMMDRVITNLLGNALKYSKPGGTIKIELSELDEDVIVHVTDTGIGIPEDQIPYIFDAFFRVSRDSKGSGLGLAITKTIIEAHEGRLSVESSLGKGSTFSFCLPKKESGKGKT